METYKMDGSTTYCYYISEKYSQELPLDGDVLVQDTGSACPITVRVDIADKLEKNALIPVRYTATLSAANADPDFEFPDPIVPVEVPEYLLTSTNMSAEAPDSTIATTYDVAVSNVVICDWRSCDIFSTASDTGTYYSGRNNPNDFSDNVAVFGSSEIVISKEGKYTGFAHLVVNIAGNSRADFVTFFPVQIGEVAGTAPSSITTDGKTTYCWTSKDVSVFDPSVSGDLTIRTNDYCPGVMTMSLSDTNVYVGDTIDVAWKLDMSDSSTDDPTLIAEVSTTDAIKDPRTDIFSVVPVSVFSGCQTNAENANCSTYTGGDSTTFDIKQVADQNLTSNAVRNSGNYTFDTAGDFTMIGRVAMVTVDGERIDLAIYSTVTVAVNAGSGSSFLFLYIGLGIGAAILLAGMLFCFLKKRRNDVSTKDIPFRQPAAAVSVLERSSDFTIASSNFVTHKSPAQLRTLPTSGDYSSQGHPSYVSGGGATEANRGYSGDSRAGATQQQQQHYTQQYAPQQQQYSQHQELESSESFSLDPYERESFAELNDDDDDQYDPSSRPSEASKFSFQSEYDDETEWEFDTKHIGGVGSVGSSVDGSSRFSDFSSDAGVTRGTFDMPRGMPILEEDLATDTDADSRTGGTTSATDPRSTASSGWTVGLN